MNKAVVALANKIARIGWRIVAQGEHYDVNLEVISKLMMGRRPRN